MKNPQTPAGIEPATFRLVAQYLNHCATVVPLFKQYSQEKNAVQNTNAWGCCILGRIFSNYISTLLLNIILLAGIKYIQRRKFIYNITLWRVRVIFLPPTLS